MIQPMSVSKLPPGVFVIHIAVGVSSSTYNSDHDQTFASLGLKCNYSTSVPSVELSVSL